MLNKSVDVFIYIQSQEGEGTYMDIVKAVSSQKGILKAACNHKVNNMIDLIYDPELTSGNEILNFVRDKACNSYLVGM